MKNMLLAVLGFVAVCHGFEKKTTWEVLSRTPDYSFEDYVVEFAKAYSGEEYKRRSEIFAKNLAFIRTWNSDPTNTATLGLNEFADWTNEEFRAQRTGIDRHLFHRQVAAAAEAAARVTRKAPAALPAQVDWRTKGVVTPVKNQGGCGSCWAFSATETIESAVAIATGKLLTLSPQQLVSCAPNPQECGGTGGCQGSTQPVAFNYTMTAGGLSNETSYPYRGVNGRCEQQKVHPAAKIEGQVVLPRNNGSALAQAVAEEQPVAISVAAGGLAWQMYEGGVVTRGCGHDIDHAVQLVGYGTDAGQDYWLVRNSWGPTWGEKGYIRIQRHADGQAPCAEDTSPQDGFGCKNGPSSIEVCGLCGILSYSSYVTGAKAI